MPEAKYQNSPPPAPPATATADSAAPPKRDSPARAPIDLKTSLSWTPPLHDRKLQLRLLTAFLLAGVIYACFHFGLYLNTQLALSTEQQRVDQLFAKCLDHAAESQRVVFSGSVRRAKPASQSATAGITETIAPLGDGYAFGPWSDLSRVSDPTAFVGRLGDRLAVITVDGNPTGGRADAGNLALHVSTYAADLPLRRKWDGDAQLNIYLRDGATFQVFEGARDSGGDGAAIVVETGKRRVLIHARLDRDGSITLFDDAREITHDTTVHELDLTGRE
jgi:hypothetical protein